MCAAGMVVGSALDDWPEEAKVSITAFAVAVATVIELPDSFDAPGKPFLLYFIISSFCALAFGLRAGLLAIATSSILSALFFEPVLSFKISNQSDQNCIFAFAAIGSANVLALARIKASIAARVRVREEQKSRLILSEMAHRVANNFSAAVSIIGRSSASVHDAGAKRALDDALNQLYIFASVHNQLRPDRDGNLIVDSKEFIGGLCAALEKTITSETSLRFQHSAASIALALPQAVSLGLIVNELVTNSVKYAFSKGYPGTIDVSVTVLGSECHVCVADNGTGIASKVNGSGRGLRLVEGLAVQLGGSFSLEKSTGGTLGRVRFSLPRDNATPSSPRRP
jgi:two-component sensor histidine kinase